MDINKVKRKEMEMRAIASQPSDIVQEMWLINSDRPWLPAMKSFCSIKIGKSMIIARLGDRLFVYGSSVFGTFDAAQRRRRGLMLKIMNVPGAQKFRKYAYQACETAMERMKRDGQ